MYEFNKLRNLEYLRDNGFNVPWFDSFNIDNNIIDNIISCIDFTKHNYIIRACYRYEDSSKKSFAGIFPSFVVKDDSDLKSSIKRIKQIITEELPYNDYILKNTKNIDISDFKIIIQEHIKTKKHITVFTSFYSDELVRVEIFDSESQYNFFAEKNENFFDFIIQDNFSIELLQIINEIEQIYLKAQNIELILDHKNSLHIVQSRDITINKEYLLLKRINYHEINILKKNLDLVKTMIYNIFNINANDREDFIFLDFFLLVSPDFLQKIKEMVSYEKNESYIISVTEKMISMYAKKLKNFNVNKIEQMYFFKEFINHFICNISEFKILLFKNKYKMCDKELLNILRPENALIKKDHDESKIKKAKKIESNNKIYPEIVFIENMIYYSTLLDFYNLDYVKFYDSYIKKKVIRNHIYDLDESIYEPIFINFTSNISGKVIKIKKEEPELLQIDDNSIIVIDDLTPQLTKIILNAKALIVKSRNIISHASIIAQEYEIPVILGFDVNKIQDGNYISIDFKKENVLINDNK